MKNKLIFRILGALASALIIVSVFVPFVSVTGYSQSLWQAHSAVGTLYLPIMIIAFGAIGVIFFSINIKTELAYTSSGALLFFLVMQTIPIIDQGTFNTLSVGYYCLAIGTVFTGIMAFLCNLRTKKKIVETTVAEEQKEDSMINQIDKLYDNQANTSNELENNELENIIQPLQALNVVQPQDNMVESVNQEIVVDNQLTPTVDNDLSGVEPPMSLQNLSNDIVEPVQEPQVTNSVTSEFSVSQQNVETSNPVVAEFDNLQLEVQEQTSNPVVSEFGNVKAETQQTQSINPVVSEFSEPQQNVEIVNPVVSEFNQPVGQPSILSQPVEQPQMLQPQEQVVETIQPLGVDRKVDVMADNQSNSSNNSNLDIFG